MKTPAVLGTVALTELTAHFLSLGWGIMTLLAAFAWVALSGASVAAKARSTEDRLTALVPVIGTASSLAANAFPRTGGTVTGSVVVNGDHHVVGSLYGVGGTLSIGDHVQANSSVTVAGDHTVNGNTNAAGGITGAGGGTLENPSGFHSAGTVQADASVLSTDLYVNGQRIAPGQGDPAGYPYVGGTIANVDNGLNAIVSGLRAAGIFA